MGSRRQTIEFKNGVYILEAASTAGVKEGEGPLRSEFDAVLTDDRCGEDSWELAQSRMQEDTVRLVLDKANERCENIGCIFSGDLLNQCAGTHYAMRNLDIPFLGLYGACSTMSESLIMAAAYISGGFMEKAIATTSSHFCSAERQFRYPLEYGGQRTPSAQWTVTGCGAMLLSRHQGGAARVTGAAIGKAIDFGVTDVNNMGAAMAPAAADTLTALFSETHTRPEDYDLILTGDLGVVGSDIFTELMMEEGYDIGELHMDCGKMIYDIEAQDVHAGGSGCGCSASVLCGKIYNDLKNKLYDKIIFMATGALMSITELNQGESIPSVAHAVIMERN